MNVQCRDRGPGGHRGEEVELEDVEGEFGEVGGEWEHQSDGNGVVYKGDRCRKDGATSGARCDSIRVEARPLAGDEGGQHDRHKRTMVHVPEPSTPLPNSPK